jgi:hypothetical protein
MLRRPRFIFISEVVIAWAGLNTILFKERTTNLIVVGCPHLATAASSGDGPIFSSMVGTKPNLSLPAVVLAAWIHGYSQVADNVSLSLARSLLRHAN